MAILVVLVFTIYVPEIIGSNLNSNQNETYRPNFAKWAQSPETERVYMTTSSRIAYHLHELEIAKHPELPAYAMPEFSVNDKAILDIGCGIGQTFVASELDHGKLLVGVDVDLECLIYGHRQFKHINFVNATAERLPFRNNVYDLVISRVSLPLTNIPDSLAEIESVLDRNGRVWFTLHPFSMPLSRLIRSFRRLEIKEIVYRSYVIFNGLTFNLFGRLYPFPVKKEYESFQSISGMMKAMKKAGFIDIWVRRKGRQIMICTARKRA